MRVALGIEYDGFKFCGWQTQPDGCGVQDHVEAALGKLAAQPIKITAAGRTDAGVHALAQVVHFDTEVQRDDVAWVRGTNAHLDANIRIVWSAIVEPDFHARFSATARGYDYWLLNDPVGPGLWHGKAGWFHAPLDVEQMQTAANALLGEHDFTTFRAAECQAKTPVRTLECADLSRHGQLVRFHFRANAFLHHMVRNLVGSLVYIGCGRQPVSWMAEILQAQGRSLAAPTFAPDGLYLSEVVYPAPIELPAFRRRHWMHP